MPLYFDHNATTPIDERVLAAMLPFLSHYYANPSSLYKQGRLVRSAIDSAREQVAALVGVNANQVIFTSGGTEANNLALNYLNTRDILAISTTEHSSISEIAHYKKNTGQLVITIPVDNNGLITEQSIDELIKKRPTFVAIMLANNETGVIQNVAYIAMQLKEHGIAVHTDAVQAVGKIPVDFKQLNVQSLSLSAHKIYAAKGAGALIIAENAIINPLFWGGGQEQNYRAGTENVAAIIAFGKAAELAKSELTNRFNYLLALRQLLEQKLAELNDITIFAQCTKRLPNTTQFSITGIDGEMLVMQLDTKGVSVSSGSACASSGNMASSVLTAMGIEENMAKGAIRVSLGMNNTPRDIETFIKILTDIIIKQKGAR